MPDNALNRLGIKVPIIQAPMAGTSTPELAAAVSNAGGLGSLGLASSTVDQAREAIAKTRSLTSGSFNANFFCHRPATPDPTRETVWLRYLAPLFAEFGAEPPDSLAAPYLSFVENTAMQDMVVEECPPVVSFHFGLPPADVIKRFKDAGIVLMATATKLSEAQAIEAAGLDFIVAQGWEAGGHRGVFDPDEQDRQLTTLSLLTLLGQRCSLPIIAAGGIMDGAGIRAVRRLGACAAQMGTAFVVCPESAANQAYRNALSSDAALRTRFTTAISGRPARGISSRVHIDIDTPGRPILPDFPICYVATKALQKAAADRGEHGFASHWAGQGAPLARSMPAAELVRLLIEEMVSQPPL